MLARSFLLTGFLLCAGSIYAPSRDIIPAPSSGGDVEMGDIGPRGSSRGIPLDELFGELT